jgi:hypothetical protein
MELRPHDSWQIKQAGILGEKVNILGGDNMGHCQKKS